MTRSTTIRNLLLALALVSSPGCKKHPTMDIPMYPGSAQASVFPNAETAAGTLYHVRRVTPDGLNTVSDFYRKQLVEQRGWTEQLLVGPAFTDSNLTVERPGQIGTATPVDPTRPGGFVLVYASQDATYVELWQHVPAVK
jgi:hypothetical protein